MTASMERRQTPCRREEAMPTRLSACLTRLEKQLMRIELALRAAARQGRMIRQRVDISRAVLWADLRGHCRTRRVTIESQSRSMVSQMREVGEIHSPNRLYRNVAVRSRHEGVAICLVLRMIR